MKFHMYPLPCSMHFKEKLSTYLTSPNDSICIFEVNFIPSNMHQCSLQSKIFKPIFCCEFFVLNLHSIWSLLCQKMCTHSRIWFSLHQCTEIHIVEISHFSIIFCVNLMKWIWWWKLHKNWIEFDSAHFVWLITQQSHKIWLWQKSMQNNAQKLTSSKRNQNVASCVSGTKWNHFLCSMNFESLLKYFFKFSTHQFSIKHALKGVTVCP